MAKSVIGLPRRPGTTSVAELAKRFETMYGRRPCLYGAPGRVNLIGEHIDYNDGWVMPAAIGFHTWVACGARPDRKLQVHSDGDLAEAAPGVFGARLTGGGFGGCTINLAPSAAMDGFKYAVGQGYKKKAGRWPEIYVSAAAEGVEEVDWSS